MKAAARGVIDSLRDEVTAWTEEAEAEKAEKEDVIHALSELQDEMNGMEWEDFDWEGEEVAGPPPPLPPPVESFDREFCSYARLPSVSCDAPTFFLK